MVATVSTVSMRVPGRPAAVFGMDAPLAWTFRCSGSGMHRRR
jgi:hypothetical protein